MSVGVNRINTKETSEPNKTTTSTRLQNAIGMEVHVHLNANTKEGG